MTVTIEHNIHIHPYDVSGNETHYAVICDDKVVALCDHHSSAEVVRDHLLKKVANMKRQEESKNMMSQL